MAEHKITVDWQRQDPDFNYETFDRTYTITFGGGRQIEASNPPQYFGRAELPNPEELLISAVASCYMLTFLAVACKQGFIVDRYTCEGIGVTGKNEQGQNCITEITLKINIQFSGAHQPDSAALARMQEKAHQHCFISNSIRAHLNITLQLTE